MATTQADIQNKIKLSKQGSKDKNLESYIEILEQMPDFETVKSEKIKLSSEEDLESLLKLAEELREKSVFADLETRIYQQQIAFSYLLLGLVFLSTPLCAYLIYSLNGIDDNLMFYLLRVLFSFLLSLILFSIIYSYRNNKKISAIKKNFASDKLALKEVLQLLREVHGTIAKREDWSILKRAEFRIRLSRFDLSEKKESVFSFFS